MHASRFDLLPGAPYNSTSDVWDFQIIKHMLKKWYYSSISYVTGATEAGSYYDTFNPMFKPVLTNIYYPCTRSLISASLQFMDLKCVQLITTKLFPTSAEL